MKHLFHIDPHTERKICTLCNASVSSPYDHIENKHLKNEMAYQCYYCDMTFRATNSRRGHIFKYHREENKLAKAFGKKFH